jgi:fatty-acyl-CoA synthase
MKLLSLGLQKGDRVGVYSPNNAEWALLQMACARADLVLVNVNPAF